MIRWTTTSPSGSGAHREETEMGELGKEKRRFTEEITQPEPLRRELEVPEEAPQEAPAEPKREKVPVTK